MEIWTGNEIVIQHKIVFPVHLILWTEFTPIMLPFHSFTQPLLSLCLLCGNDNWENKALCAIFLTYLLVKSVT